MFENRPQFFQCFSYGGQILPPLTTLSYGHKNFHQTLNCSKPLRPNNRQKFMEVDSDLVLTLSQFEPRSAHWIGHYGQKKKKWVWVSANKVEFLSNVIALGATPKKWVPPNWSISLPKSYCQNNYCWWYMSELDSHYPVVVFAEPTHMKSTALHYKIPNQFNAMTHAYSL